MYLSLKLSQNLCRGQNCRLEILSKLLMCFFFFFFVIRRELLYFSCKWLFKS